MFGCEIVMGSFPHRLCCSERLFPDVEWDRDGERRLERPSYVSDLLRCH